MRKKNPAIAPFKIAPFAFPKDAKTPGMIHGRAFEISAGGFIIRVLHCREPYRHDGTLGVHISISKSRHFRPHKVTSIDMRRVRQACRKQRLAWPACEDLTIFKKGDHAGLGIHVWEDSR